LGKLLFFNIQGEEGEDIQVIVKEQDIIKEIEEKLITGDLIKIFGEVKTKKSIENNNEEEFEILLKS